MAGKAWKKVAVAAAIAFCLLNLVCFIHAYKFTHFSTIPTERTKDPKQLSAAEKIQTLLLGIDNPRPVNREKPGVPYETIRLEKSIECWRIKAAEPKGTVILFHGYAGKKSSLLERSYAFLRLNYSVLLVDFKGSGGSAGNSTSIGFHEAAQVISCYDFLAREGEERIYLFGTSMGAAAILKSVYDHSFQPAGIILECPFGSLYKTTCARFRNMKAPSFPFAGLMIFWGGVQNDFWAFGHNPVKYAGRVSCPALLVFGEKDDRVSREEIDGIFKNLKGKKELVVYPSAGHNDLFGKAWKQDVRNFLTAQEPLL